MDASSPDPGLQIEAFERRVQHLFFSGLTYLATTKRLDLTDHQIAEIESARQRLMAFIDGQFAYIIRNATERARNQRLFSDYEYKLISLGVDCLSRTLPTRWGLKPPKARGERTHPFDLAVHPYEAVCQLLETDFAGYLDPADLALSGRGYVVHKTMKIHFNHEVGEDYAANDFEKFIATYEKRIANFREDVSNHPVLFVIHMETNELPIALYDILTRRSGRDDWHLLAINTSDQPYAGAAVVPERLHLAHVPSPPRPFVWHLVQHFTTPEGYAFERRIVAALRQAVVGNFRRRS